MRSSSRLLANITSKPAANAISAAASSGESAVSLKKEVTRLRKQPLPSLEHFIQRQRVVHLYREILRHLYTIPPSAQQQRNEFMKHARSEFERNRNVKDITQIRYLISLGKAEMKGWERMIQELAQRL